MGALRDMFEEHPADVVAPIHGPPIAADDLEAYLTDLELGVRSIVEAAS